MREDEMIIKSEKNMQEIDGMEEEEENEMGKKIEKIEMVVKEMKRENKKDKGIEEDIEIINQKKKR